MTAKETMSATRIVNAEKRAVEQTAAPRCAGYAILSELACSPHDIDPRPGMHNRIGTVREAATDLDELLHEFVELDLAALKSEYSALFEVGSEGPPCPIREDLQTGQRAGTREDLVRFYNYFNYTLEEKFAWAPDHLSVELEFMHFLCYREASAQTGVVSFQLAQIDFSERHLVNWVPELANSVARIAPGSIYCRTIATIAKFLTTDHAWQSSTVGGRTSVTG